MHMQLNIEYLMKARTLKLDIMRKQCYEGNDAEVASDELQVMKAMTPK